MLLMLCHCRTLIRPTSCVGIYIPREPSALADARGGAPPPSRGAGSSSDGRRRKETRLPVQLLEVSADESTLCTPSTALASSIDLFTCALASTTPESVTTPLFVATLI